MWGIEVFSFRNGFSGYNQIQIKPEDQHKTTFIYPWGTFAYKKIPFGLKNVGGTFQQAMPFSFHDIKSIVEPYLDDLPAHCRKRIDHPDHLRLIFERCRYYKIHFGLKNAGATFQWEMDFSFHDIKAIVEPYLDDLPSHSRKRIDHLDHLRLIFERCKYYKIHLNPHKCVFCVESGRLLGFIISNKGIQVDPLKVEAIISLPPPCSIRKLQRL